MLLSWLWWLLPLNGIRVEFRIDSCAFLSRYVAICHPLSQHARSSTSKAKKVVMFIWVTSVLSALPWSFFTKVNYLTYKGRPLMESAWCSIPFNEENSASLYMMLISTIVYFVLPLITVVFAYLRFDSYTGWFLENLKIFVGLLFPFTTIWWATTEVIEGGMRSG